MCRSLFRLIFAEENVKKYCLLILSLLLFLASFAVSWYGDQLFDKIFVFIIPIHIILAICFVVLLVLSIIKILKHKTHVNFASVAVLILLVIVFAFFPFRVAKTKFEFGRYEEDRIKVVEMIKNHQLQPKDEIGNIVLPLNIKEYQQAVRCSSTKITRTDKSSVFGYLEECFPALLNWFTPAEAKN